MNQEPSSTTPGLTRRLLDLCQRALENAEWQHHIAAPLMDKVRQDMWPWMLLMGVIVSALLIMNGATLYLLYQLWKPK